MHLAYCTDSTVFLRDRLRDREHSYQYPGSGWISMLYQYGASYGVEVASGDTALAHIASGKWSASDVLVVQEMASSLAMQLLDKGAVPFLITCLEAPLYAPFFYDRMAQLSQHFQRCQGFGFGGNGFRFPSYYQDDLAPAQPWKERRRMTLVAANKFKSESLYWSAHPSVRSVLRQLKWQGWRFVSPAYRQALRVCLHERRLMALNQFASTGDVDLYGGGWQEKSDLPAAWAKRLNANPGIHYQGRCQDKLAVLRAHQFSICYENIAMPGYMTEKIVDCFVAGTIPLYLGAPDVSEMIPEQSFVNLQDADLRLVDVRLAEMDEEEAGRMLQAGRDYLQSEAGQLHSYEGFARQVLQWATA